MLVTWTHRPRARYGFTLVELLIALVLLGIVAGGMLGIVRRQQRFLTGSASGVGTRSSIRRGMSALVASLRGISPRNNDIYSMSRTSIDFREQIGWTVVCTINATRTAITVPPAALSSNNGLTSWIAMPVAGDSAMIYDSNRQPGTSDDTWDLNALSATPTGHARCPQTNVGGFTTNAMEAASGWTLSFTNPLATTVVVGAPVRIFRPARYQLVQASDSRWNLTRQACSGDRCGTRVAISGPYLPAAPRGPSGLELTYYDSTGATTTIPTSVRRIDIMLRARSSDSAHTPAHPAGLYQDSLGRTVAVRN